VWWWHFSTQVANEGILLRHPLAAGSTGAHMSLASGRFGSR